MSATAAKKYQKLDALTWKRVRAGVEAGETWAELSRRFGVHAVTISDRAAKEGWKRPGRGEAGNPVVAASENKVAEEETAEDSGETEVFFVNSSDSGPPPALPSLISAIPGDPESFQSLLSRCAKTLIAAGISEIEPPRTVAELKTLNDIIRKADRLDEKDSAGAGNQLVAPLRTLTRRAVEVPAEVVGGEDVDPAYEFG